MVCVFNILYIKSISINTRVKYRRLLYLFLDTKAILIIEYDHSTLLMLHLQNKIRTPTGFAILACFVPK
jgi:hypothetical protein